jgi:S-adenosyl-L-methionine hydrolase (adenosine-forming)
MLITLTTDFGQQDSFVGIMKGVIAGIDPEATVVDLTHGIPAQNILAGALTLRHSIEYFPRGTTHVAVVDPGVGGERRPLLIESDGNYFIGPDNGLLSLAVGTRKPNCVVELSNPAYHLRPTSGSFHGRDIFAPVAAHLSRGVPVAEFGKRLETFHRLILPEVSRTLTELSGEVIYVDGFGNLFTNISRHDLTGFVHQQWAITLGSIRIPGLSPNYAATHPGNFVAIINSWGLVEIGVYQGNAQRRSGAKVGEKVRFTIGT